MSAVAHLIGHARAFGPDQIMETAVAELDHDGCCAVLCALDKLEQDRDWARKHKTGWPPRRHKLSVDERVARLLGDQAA